jgi:hypothetical protein
MRTIWKFKLDPYIKMPIGYKILKAQWMDNAIYVWAEVDTLAPTENVFFEVFTTGQEIQANANLDYIDTCYIQPEGLIFHIYVWVSI